MSDSWDDYAEGWDTDSDVIRFADEAFKSLSNIINLDNLRVLDFGCGTGLLTERLSSLVSSIVALDPSEKMITVLKTKHLPNVETILGYISRDFIKDHNEFSAKFDLVVASSVCGFLPNYEEILRLIKTLLTQNGPFVQWDWMSTGKDSDFGLSKQNISDSFRSVGLTVSEIILPFSFETEKGNAQIIMGGSKKCLR